MVFKVRPSTPDDISALVPFINASWVRTYAPLIGEDTARLLAEEKHTEALFAREIDASDAVSLVGIDDSGAICGHIGGFENAKDSIYIDRFHVAPAFHGSGVAMALIDEAAKILAHCYTRIELTVLEGNERAMAFYLKAGFKIDKHRTPAPGLGERDAIMMVMKMGAS